MRAVDSPINIFREVLLMKVASLFKIHISLRHACFNDGICSVTFSVIYEEERSVGGETLEDSKRIFLKPFFVA